MAEAVRERPAGVPEGGFWNPEVGGWEVSRRNAQGARDGECLFYRPDGGLQSRCTFVNGVQEGTFAILHPDGRLAREGTFAAGKVEGLVSAYAGEGTGAEPLRACCVPAAAVRLDQRYEGGAVMQEIFYDSSGQPILSDGRPIPTRPASVPRDADYDEAGPRWTRWRPDSHRAWSAAGVLETESEYDGLRRTTRTFDADGRLVESCQVSKEGTRDGAFLRRFVPGGPSPYADPAIREERGTFDRGQAVGSWTFVDGDGTERRRAARGLAFDPGSERTSPVFAPGAEATADDWRALATALRAEGRVREALCAVARAAVRDGDRAELSRALATDVVPLRPELAAERGDALVQSVDSTVASILDGLVSGGDPAAAFRALAAVLPGAHPAAPDFVAASLLLAPERRLTHLTRALVRFQHGDEPGARADVELVAAEAPDAAAALTEHMEAAWRPFLFWPAREVLVPDPSLAELGAGLVRELGEVRAAIAVYASRIARVRAAIRALVGPAAAPAWLPPDPSPLLPAGPVPLRQARVTVDLGEGESVEAEIDEELATAGLGVPALLGEAQAEWGALGWLCWSVGLDRVALPETVAEPPLFAVAMKTIVTRCWRAQDRLTTGGLLARAKGIPGFSWEGRDVDALPRQLAQAAAEEYVRARSLFLWLASPDVASPFQVDLRGS